MLFAMVVVTVLVVVLVAVRRPPVEVATVPLNWRDQPLEPAPAELVFVLAEALPASFEFDIQLVGPPSTGVARSSLTRRQLERAQRRPAALLAGRIRVRHQARQIRFWRQEVKRRVARAA